MAEIIDTEYPLNGEDLTGKKFGRWTAVGYLGRRQCPYGRWKKIWNCMCDCGTQSVLTHNSLKNGGSCGCLKREIGGKCNVTHGLYRSPIYNVWMGMKARCLNPNCKQYVYYGGRGIKIDPAWLESFKAFHSDMSPSWKRGLWIERIDNNGHYCKANCRWATQKEQANNKRNNHKVTLHGETKTIAAWASEEGRPNGPSIRYRLKRGLPPELALAPIKNLP